MYRNPAASGESSSKERSPVRTTVPHDGLLAVGAHVLETTVLSVVSYVYACVRSPHSGTADIDGRPFPSAVKRSSPPESSLFCFFCYTGQIFRTLLRFYRYP
ncbi:hypothetical protein MRX96_002664 [Rhipicephalus microplus]